jgi:hypothetical protein
MAQQELQVILKVQFQGFLVVAPKTDEDVWRRVVWLEAIQALGSYVGRQLREIQQSPLVQK